MSEPSLLPKVRSAATWAGPAGPARGLVLRALTWLIRAEATWRDRDRLLALDQRMLKDIGLSRSDAEREAERLRWSAWSVRPW